MTTRPQRGRPRNRPSTSDLAPIDDILMHASRLFARYGFAGTSTRRIADAVGIQQSTVFHYFPTKIDILRALSSRAHDVPFAALEEQMKRDAPVANKLYQIIHTHTSHVASSPLDLTAVLQDPLPLQDESDFEEWHQDSERYTRRLAELIESGVRRGEFVQCNPFVRAMGILGMCNWTIRWYRHDGVLSPDDVAREYARATLRSLLVEPNNVDGIERQEFPPS